MNTPLVSVIIPAYNQADFLGDAIRSALEQSYTNIEVIVVDDQSPDHTAEVVGRFSDPRLRYIAHESNRMLAAARNTGMRAAQGELLALLDADDYYHKAKLALHVEFLQSNPDVGVSYSGRFELRCSDGTPRNLARVPATVTLADLVLGFPFNPSDMVLRRAPACSIDCFDESFTHFSEDLDFNCRLALAGCKFGGLDRCLTYRRYHAGRVLRNPRQRLDGALRALHAAFRDPHMPPAVRALEKRAYANNFVVWGVEALRGFDTVTGLEFLREAVRCQPGLLVGHPNELTQYLVYEAAHDDTLDLADVYSDVVDRLSDEFAAVRQQANWGIGRAWLVSAYRDLLFGRQEQGVMCLAAAVQLGATIDKPFIDEVVHQLLGIEAELGRRAAEDAARMLDARFHASCVGAAAVSFAAALELGRVYEYFANGRHDKVPAQVLRAICRDPRRALNRGSFSILMRAAAESGKLR